MTEQLRGGLVAKASAVELKGEIEIDEAYAVAGHKGQPTAVAKRGGSGAAAGWQERQARTRLARPLPREGDLGRIRRERFQLGRPWLDRQPRVGNVGDDRHSARSGL